jgi:hypothetical protein
MIEQQVHATTVASRPDRLSADQGVPVTAPHLPAGTHVPDAPVRVVPLGVTLGTVAGQRLILLSLEIWPQWTDLRFARIDVGAARPLPRRVPPVGAWQIGCDDAAVEVLDAVGRGDRHFSNGEVRLAVVPAAGARLEVTVEVVPGAPALTGTLQA